MIPFLLADTVIWSAKRLCRFKVEFGGIMERIYVMTGIKGDILIYFTE